LGRGAVVWNLTILWADSKLSVSIVRLLTNVGSTGVSADPRQGSTPSLASGHFRRGSEEIRHEAAYTPAE
jgi:hypothetical protein